jgi:transposase
MSDPQWNQIKPLLPPQKPPTGCPAKDHRTIINGILWILRTGAPWRDLPRRYGPWSTVSGRFYHWRKIGLWEQVLSALQAQADAAGKLNWDIHFVDGSVIRAHQHAAGAKRGS